jgi:hypothetical protein
MGERKMCPCGGLLKQWQFTIISKAGVLKWFPQKKFTGPVTVDISRCPACGRNDWKKTGQK